MKSENRKAKNIRRKAPAKKGGARKKCGRRRKGMLLTFLAVVVIVALAIASTPYIFAGAPTSAMVKIERSLDREKAAQALKDSLTNLFDADYAQRTMKVMSVMNVDLTKRSGAYMIEKGTSPAMAAKILAYNGQTPVKITINGFRTPQVMAERISKKMQWPADSLLAAMQDPDLMAQYGLTPEQAMALFVDATYEVYWTTSPRALIKRVGDYYKKVWNPERLAKAAKLGITPAQAMTICSIVEEETLKNDEKGRIGRLYLNRLQKGMKLQADPTVRYAIGDFTIKRVTSQHTAVQSPYNTYYVTGLPPGPIRTVPVSTIDALLDSEPSTDLYMCAREDFSGYHNFAADYDTHMANARRYQQALDERNIH